MTAVPTFATRRDPRRRSWGAAVEEIADALTGARLPWQCRIGSPLMPWQKSLSEVATEVDHDGCLWYRTVIVTVQRQAGKTSGLRPIMAQKAQQGRHVWFTAQTRAHARKRWMDLTMPIASQLGRGVVKHNTGVGIEELRWLTGGRGGVTPFAPNETGMHGETPDDVMTDEGWKFTLEQAAAMQGGYEFGFATKPDPQEWILSTQGTVESEWFALLTETGRAAVADPYSRTAYFEYSMPAELDGVPVGQLPDDVLLELIFAHHPADGFTLQRDRVVDTLGKVHEGRISRPEFLRGYGNLPTGKPSLGGVWPGGVWSAAGTDLAPVGTVGLGVDVDPDGRGWALTAAGRAAGGQVVLEVVKAGDGAPGAADVAYVRDVVGRQRPTSLYGIGAGACADFLDLLESGGARVQRIAAADLGAANSRVLQGIAKLTVLHRKQPEMDQAQKAGTVRESGDRRLLARSGTAPVAALQAGVLAAWALDHPDGAQGPFRIIVPRRAS